MTCRAHRPRRQSNHPLGPQYESCHFLLGPPQLWEASLPGFTGWGSEAPRGSVTCPEPPAGEGAETLLPTGPHIRAGQGEIRKEWSLGAQPGEIFGSQGHGHDQ